MKKTNIFSLLWTPGEYHNGINSFKDWKFYLVLILYAASFLIFAHDKFFHTDNGAFLYTQGIVTLTLSLVVCASFTWELTLFGKPTGANLLLQTVVMLPFALMNARLLANPSMPSEPTGEFTQIIKQIKGVIAQEMPEMLPEWVIDLFANGRITVLFILILFILCLRNLTLKTGGIIFIYIVLFFNRIAGESSLGHLIFGTILLIVGLSMQFCRYDKLVYWENVIRRFQTSPTAGKELFSVMLSIMDKLSSGKPISEPNYTQIVRSVYSSSGIKLADNEANQTAASICREMIYTYNMVSLKNDNDGIFLHVDPLLFRDENLLCAVATFPRVIFALVFAFLWIFMPFDLIPDALPFIGTLDDVTVAVLSGIVVHNSMLPGKRI